MTKNHPISNKPGLIVQLLVSEAEARYDPILAHRGTESGIEKGPTLHLKLGISILRKIMTKLIKKVKISGPRAEARGRPERVLGGPGGSQEPAWATLGP